MMLVGMAKGESNIRGRNKGRTYLSIFFPIISIVGDGGRGEGLSKHFLHV
jgi:hypothetical protein